MKLFCLVGLVYQAAGLVYSEVGVCHVDKRWERKSFHDMPPNDLNRFYKAFQKLQYSKQWREFVDDYVGIEGMLSTGKFLPFNRAMLFRLEQKLKHVDPQVSLPYWDSSEYSQKPEMDPAFSDSNFGGQASKNGCVTNGRFSGQCIRRSRDFFKKTFVTGEMIDLQYLQEKSEMEFGRRIEYGLLPKVTLTINSNLKEASLDPLHFLHLTYIDKLWNDWQKRHFGYPKGIHADLRLWRFSHDHVLDTLSHMCYYYREKTHAWELNFEIPTHFISHNIKSIKSSRTAKAYQPRGKKYDTNYLYSFTAAPKYFDKSDVCNLRPTPPMSPSYANTYRYDLAKVRLVERQEIDLITTLNLRPNYFPQSAINPKDKRCKDLRRNRAKTTRLAKTPIQKLFFP